MSPPSSGGGRGVNPVEPSPISGGGRGVSPVESIGPWFGSDGRAKRGVKPSISGRVRGVKLVNSASCRGVRPPSAKGRGVKPVLKPPESSGMGRGVSPVRSSSGRGVKDSLGNAECRLTSVAAVDSVELWSGEGRFRPVMFCSIWRMRWGGGRPAWANGGINASLAEVDAATCEEARSFAPRSVSRFNLRRYFWACVRTCVGLRVPTWLAMALTFLCPNILTASKKRECSSSVQYRVWDCCSICPGFSVHSVVPFLS
mmetsp:Transcript_33873/g.79308  ORF Transcript_33873/g.79308 Transcript_33873/m.79308 type:complete len:257 (+) Transcript_33873:204-974(+)